MPPLQNQIRAIIDASNEVQVATVIALYDADYISERVVGGSRSEVITKALTDVLKMPPAVAADWLKTFGVK